MDTSETEYSKREMDVFLADLRGSLSRNEVANAEIISQTKKTNGSIAAVQSAFQFWKGAVSVLSGVILVIVIPMSGWLLTEVYSMNGNLDKRISTAITTALINYGLIRK